eukprot:3019340-Pyramimonas_sp.AAC.1
MVNNEHSRNSCNVLNGMCAELRRKLHVENGPPYIRKTIRMLKTNARGAMARATCWTLHALNP